MKSILKNIFVLAFLITTSRVCAQTLDPVDKNKIANGGYDLLAYFSDNTAVKEKKEFIHQIKGIKYQFVSAEHKTLFANNPEKYLPMCDGYCAWGVAEKGKKVPVNPQTFKVINGKLYLFFNGDFNSSPFNTLNGIKTSRTY